MRCRSRAFLLAELAVAVAIFSGVVLMIVVFLTTATDVVAANSDRVRAANRADEVLNEVRGGNITVVDGATTEIKPAENGSLLPVGRCGVEVLPWPNEPGLRRVVVTVNWKRPGMAASSLKLETLVRKGRLQLKDRRRQEAVTEKSGQ